MISGKDLSEEQQAAVKRWADEGCSLGEIQDRLGKEFDVKLTYMNMHLLMLDLDISLEEEEEPEPEPEAVTQSNEADAPGDLPQPPQAGLPTEPPPPVPFPTPGAEESLSPEPAPAEPADPSAPAANATVTIDEVVRPGAVASGTVIFPGGQQATWLMDQFGRMGLDPKDPTYNPSEEDVMAFQVELQRIARERGL